MSSPQTHQKSSNPRPINKIKVLGKWFLVMVKSGKIELEDSNKRRPGHTAGPKSFILHNGGTSKPRERTVGQELVRAKES
jgi:hypothetical protein